MSLLAVAFPIVPGKLEQWYHFVDELNTTRRQDFVASRRRLGLHERTFVQQTPMGDLALVTEEGDNPQRIFESFTNDDPFARWMNQELAPLHGVDLSQPMPANILPEVVLDSGNEPNGSELLAFVLPVLPGKLEQWRRFTAELNGPRRAEFVASRERLGLRQRVFHQSTPMGDLSIVTLLGAEPRAIRQWFTSGDPLAAWVAEQIKATQGVDMTQPLPESATARLMLDTERPAISRAA